MNPNNNMATGAPIGTANPAYTTGLGTTNLNAAAGPGGAILPSGETVAHPSALKGNVTALVGKLTHNPEKQLAGNAMVASSKEAKALRFEEKAITWERKGNLNKATKNREKAARYRQRALAKVSTPVNTTYQENKAARCEAKAIQYEQKGNFSKAQKNRERALRIRQKHNISNNAGITTVPGVVPAAVPYPTPLGTGAPMMGSGVPLGAPLAMGNGVPMSGAPMMGSGAPMMGSAAPMMGSGAPLGAPLATGGLGGLGGLGGHTHVDPITGQTVHHNHDHQQIDPMSGRPIHSNWNQYYGGQNYAMGPNGYPRLSRDQKASRFEQKAAEYERRGDLQKAQKNREKAMRHRQYAAPGYVAQPRPAGYYNTKLQRLQQQQQRYQQQNNTLAAQRAQARANRLRTKHNIM